MKEPNLQCAYCGLEQNEWAAKVSEQEKEIEEYRIKLTRWEESYMANEQGQLLKTVSEQSQRIQELTKENEESRKGWRNADMIVEQQAKGILVLTKQVEKLKAENKELFDKLTERE